MQKILYVGMDVHQATIVIVVLNVEGKTISEAIIETKTETVRKSAAQSACASEPFKQQYDALVAKGINAALARLTVTRKLAAITLAIWKRGEPFDAQRAVKRAA